MFENKKILVLGMARSGYAASKYLANRGNTVILNDGGLEEKQDKDKVQELKDLGVTLIFGTHPDDLLDNSFDYIIKNPGIRNDHKYIVKAEELGIEVINEVEMAYRLLPKDITLIGITGTNGKTTTTTLTYNILKKAYQDRVHLTGNIGYPLCELLDKVKKDDIIVMEVSVQQSVNIKEFKPDIGLLTNFFPAHIDFVGSYENYKNIKAKMFRNQNDNDIAIINMENSDSIETLRDIKSNIKYFSSQKEINGCYLKNDIIYYYGEEILNIHDLKIPGMHNVENVLGSIMIAKELNVSNEIIQDVLTTFTGVEHRLEYVDTISNVEFYNDTEATNIKCSQIALSSFDRPTIIILGGLDRGQDFNELAPFMQNVKAIIGIGECRNKVFEFGSKLGIDTYIYEYLKDGFNKIKEIMSDGDIVLLSPASASWDQYKECEIRGQEFKDLVKEIKGE